MKRMMAGWTAAVLALASAGSLLAHHSLSKFDTTTAVRIKGVVVRFEQISPHSVLFVDQKGADGQIQRWAVEGPGVFQLTRMGIEPKDLKIGSVIEACGYVMKAGMDGQRTFSTEPISLSLKDTRPKSVSGRVMDAEMLVMPDGKKIRWSDYGQHLCLGPDYQDFHTK